MSNPEIQSTVHKDFCSIKEKLNAYFFIFGFYINIELTTLLYRISPYIFTFFLYLILILLNIIEEKYYTKNPKISMSKLLNSYLDRRFYFTKKITEKFIASMIFLLLILKLHLIFLILYSIMIILYFSIRCLNQYRKNYILRLNIIYWYLIFLTLIESVLCFLNINKHILEDSQIKEGYENFRDYFNFKYLFPIYLPGNKNLEHIIIFGQNKIQIYSLIVNLLIIYLILFYILNFEKEAEYINKEYKNNKIQTISNKFESKNYLDEIEEELNQTMKYASKYGKYYAAKLKELEFLKEKDKFIFLKKCFQRILHIKMHSELKIF